MWDTSFFGALTPKFYVALTGTSSLISGLILIFEWWYFRKYGTSFIEQVSLAHLGLWLGGGGAATSVAPESAGEEAAVAGAGAGAGAWAGAGAGVGAGVGVGAEEVIPIVCRNPTALLRGAEYARLWTMARRAPLTYYDMNLTAQEHQAWFGCVGDGPAEEALGRAWREREPRARVAAAREALRHAPDCAAALLLLAEEDAPTVLEAERVMRRAFHAAVAGAAAAAAAGAAGGTTRARDAMVLAHVKCRAALCCRRLGRLRDASRLLRELARESPPAPDHPVLDLLLEVLLEQRLYSDAMAHVARLDEMKAPESACFAYTRALLVARAAGAGEQAPALAAAAGDALRRALVRNPHVPAFLLELRALHLPPEHYQRGGRSEALAYAFFHLQHWRACPVALRRLEAAWLSGPRADLRLSCADRELLAGGGAGAGAGAGVRGVCGRRGLAVVALCAAACALAACGAACWSRGAGSAAGARGELMAMWRRLRPHILREELAR